jgi:cytochrome c
MFENSLFMGAIAALTLSAASHAATPGDVAAGKQAFAKCMACHKVDASGTSTIGPNLYKVAGRRSGTLPGFRYSPAMIAAKRVWTDGALDAYLTSPAKSMPGNRMPFAGIPDGQERKALIAYLKTLGK